MKDDGLYLRHIHEAIIRILEFTVDGEEAFRRVNHLPAIRLQPQKLLPGS